MSDDERPLPLAERAVDALVREGAHTQALSQVRRRLSPSLDSVFWKRCDNLCTASNRYAALSDLKLFEQEPASKAIKIEIVIEFWRLSMMKRGVPSLPLRQCE